QTRPAAPGRDPGRLEYLPGVLPGLAARRLRLCSCHDALARRAAAGDCASRPARAPVSRLADRAPGGCRARRCGDSAARALATWDADSHGWLALLRRGDERPAPPALVRDHGSSGFG